MVFIYKIKLMIGEQCDFYHSFLVNPLPRD